MRTAQAWDLLHPSGQPWLVASPLCLSVSSPAEGQSRVLERPRWGGQGVGGGLNEMLCVPWLADRQQSMEPNSERC